MSDGKDSFDLSGLGAAMDELCAEEKEKLVASIKDMTEGLASQKRVERLREILGQYDKLGEAFRGASCT